MFISTNAVMIVAVSAAGTTLHRGRHRDDGCVRNLLSHGGYNLASDREIRIG